MERVADGARRGRARGAAVSERAARALYSTLLALLQPAYLLRLWWRGRSEPLYRHALGERFGNYAGPSLTGCVWVHAVSLGETRAAAALLDALRAARPALRLLLTHGTATGRDAGRALLERDDVQVWLPYDTPQAVKRFFAQFRPAVGVLIETEVWPNLLHAAERNGVPMVLANARLSERSARIGRRMSVALRPAARSLALVLAQSEADAERLRAAGASRVEVCGNLKFDMHPDPALLAQGRDWRRADERPIVLAASTRETEEVLLLAAWRAQPEPRPRLLIVPRHPQRFDAVFGLIAQAGFACARRSAWGGAPDARALGADVWLGDSLGEMPAYYAASRVALLGGSFGPFGGQNLIEAAACGTPVVMGPHTFNFAEAAELAIAAGAAERVADIEDGVRRALSLAPPGAADPMAERALAFAALHRGAAERMAARIAALLDRGAARSS